MIDVQKDARGVLSYTLGVRSLDGAGPQTRGVTVAAPPATNLSGETATVRFTVRNSGTRVEADASLHPRDARTYLDSDVYRLSVSVDQPGWTAHLTDALAAIKFGESTTVPVRVTRSAGAAPRATVTLTARSESDPSKMAAAKGAMQAR